MDGNFKLIVIILSLFLFSCKKKEVIKNDGEIILKDHISVLLDSLEVFNWTKFQTRNNPRSVYQKIHEKDFIYELLDSIVYDKNSIKFCKRELSSRFNFSKSYFQNIKIKTSFLSKKKDLKIKLVKNNKESEFSLSIFFSNLVISESKKFACVIVKKHSGISMKEEIYFFIKRNGKWIYDGKKIIGIG